MGSKDVGIRIRVERELRDAFQQACASENRQASDLLREFMKTYAERKVNGLQFGLFAVEEPRPQYSLTNELRSAPKPTSRGGAH
jgi:hypothetical protein